MKDAPLQSQPLINSDVVALKQEVVRLNAALKRTTEKRDIFKKAAEYAMGKCKTTFLQNLF